MANSVGFDPVWEGSDEARQLAFFHLYNGAPEGEDYVRFVIRNYDENDWMLQVGPLGAYSVRWHWTGEQEWYTSDPKKCDRFLVATKINADSWNVEAAIPLDQLGSPGPGGLQLRVERNRAERPREPQERWHWPEHQPTAQIASLPHEAGEEPPPTGVQAHTAGEQRSTDYRWIPQYTSAPRCRMDQHGMARYSVMDIGTKRGRGAHATLCH